MVAGCVNTKVRELTTAVEDHLAEKRHANASGEVKVIARGPIHDKERSRRQ